MKNEKTIRFVSLFIISFGIVLRIIDFLYNRLLWLDEAYLASSVVQRGYAGLVKPLDFSQGAPAGYLMIVKSFVYLFGASEYSLRLLSLLAGIGSVFMFYIVLAKVFKDSRAYVGTAFFSTIPFLIHYSAEFKPYMFDLFLALVSLYIFSMAFNQKIKLWILTLYCAVVLWFSFPAIFAVASFCIIWFVSSAVKKQKKTMLLSLLVSFVSLASFGLLYATVYQNLGQAQKILFYDRIKFPLFPHSLADLKLFLLIANEYFTVFGKWAYYVILLLSVAAISLFRWKKGNLFCAYFLVEVALLIIASGLGRYYMQTRLLLFIVPVHLLFIMCFISGLRSRNENAALILSVVLLLLSATAAVRYFLPCYEYHNDRGISATIGKLPALEKGTPLYLHVYAIPTYEYKTGYTAGLHESNPAPFEKNGVIYGSHYYTFPQIIPYSWDTKIDSAALACNAKAITSHPKVYLLFTGYSVENKTALISYLNKSGTVTPVPNYRMLYVYTKTSAVND